MYKFPPRMPCKIHDHTPWPTLGPCNFEIQRCESICGWCDYSLPAKGSANNLRAHAKRHIVNEEAFRNITVSAFKAGRGRIQVTKGTSLQSLTIASRKSETPIVGVEEIAETIETNNHFNPRQTISKETSLQITQGDQQLVQNGYHPIDPYSATRNLTGANTIGGEKSFSHGHAGVDQVLDNIPATHLSLSPPRVTSAFDVFHSPSMEQPTPATLGWDPDFIPLFLKRYKLIMGVAGNENYLELLETWPTTPQFPQIVFFNPPKSHLTVYHCRFPGSCCQLFESKTPLDKHYMEDHAYECSHNWICCDYPSCPRDVYLRMLGHYNHLRSFHNEDLPILDKDALVTNEIQKQGYRVDPSWWRCSRCLERVETLRLRCKNCHHKIEDVRLAMRLTIDSVAFNFNTVDPIMTLSRWFRCGPCWDGAHYADKPCPACPLKHVRDGLEEYLDFRVMNVRDPKKDIPPPFDIRKIIERLDRGM
ncbi:hypothetical protein B0O99DRAFT_632354 [Bisporella sp. PMI_857]|nr:hypothetical protein B0O99DRAFT_632354 [Bisporella sp. PMI_857]